jgi:hypothetical protein
VPHLRADNEPGGVGSEHFAGKMLTAPAVLCSPIPIKITHSRTGIMSRRSSRAKPSCGRYRRSRSGTQRRGSADGSGRWRRLEPPRGPEHQVQRNAAVEPGTATREQHSRSYRSSSASARRSCRAGPRHPTRIRPPRHPAAGAGDDLRLRRLGLPHVVALAALEPRPLLGRGPERRPLHGHLSLLRLVRPERRWRRVRATAASSGPSTAEPRLPREAGTARHLPGVVRTRSSRAAISP